MSTVLPNLPGTNTDIEAKKRELYMSILMMARFCPTLIEKIERWAEEIHPLMKELAEWSLTEITPHECGFSKSLPNNFDFIIKVAFFTPEFLLMWQK
jgi:hypothetical protein